MYRIFLLLFSILSCANSFAQDYSNRGLMQIKDQAEAARVFWNKSFEQAIEAKNMAPLPAQRQQLEQFIENHLLQIRKLMSQGDARALLTSVNNYLQIQRQYVRNVMIPAESFAADDPEALEKVTRQNSDFQQKEKIFLIEINNALASTRDDIPAQVDPEMSEDEEEDAAEETEKAEKPAARKGQPRKKLPHEEYDEEHADDEAEGKKSKARSKSKTKSKRGQYEDVDY